MQAPDKEHDEEQHTAHFAAHPSPAMRIDRPAPESILALLELCDPIRALAVRGEWFGAVTCMTPIRALVTRDADRLFVRVRRALAAC